MKKKGIKIKRSHRNLYKRRKSTGRKVFETILLLVIVAALVFVGYSVAPPLIKFFSDMSSDTSQSSEPVWTPPEPVSSDTSDTDSSAAETSSGTASTTVKPEDKPAEAVELNAVTAPASALASQKALEAYLDTAVKNGYDTVVFNLKNSTGELLYKSSVASVKDNTYVIKGTLTAAQIVKVCKAKDITPAASISTLRDHLIANVIEDSGYIIPSGQWSWLDAAQSNGGKPWASPYSSSTVNYISALSEELAKAGFENVILQNTIFPKFQYYDYTLLSKEVQSADRSDKLAAVAQSAAAKAKAAGADTLVQIDAGELLTINASEYKGSAEIWLSRDKMKDCTVLVTIDTATLGTSLKLTEEKTLAVDKSISKAVAQVYTRVKTATDGYNIKVGITNSSTLSDADIAAARAAFEKLGYTDIIIA